MRGRNKPKGTSNDNNATGVRGCWTGWKFSDCRFWATCPKHTDTERLKVKWEEKISGWLKTKRKLATFTSDKIDFKCQKSIFRDKVGHIGSKISTHQKKVYASDNVVSIYIKQNLRELPWEPRSLWDCSRTSSVLLMGSKVSHTDRVWTAWLTSLSWWRCEGHCVSKLQSARYFQTHRTFIKSDLDDGIRQVFTVISVTQTRSVTTMQWS